MKLIKDIYQRDNPNIDVIYNSGSSGALQQQVERGAPIDLFISASSKQMDFLLKKNLLIRESNKTFFKSDRENGFHYSNQYNVFTFAFKK